MKRLYLRLSNIPVLAILLFLVFSSAVFGQVTYTLTGTLNLDPGDSDPLLLSGTDVTAVATFNPGITPSSSSPGSPTSSNTYTSGVTVYVVLAKLGTSHLPCSTTDSPALAVTLTDTAGGQDQLGIQNCTINFAGSPFATISASAMVAAGYMVTDVPANIPAGSPVTGGTVQANAPSFGINAGFTLSSATITASGGGLPTVTPNPSAWTPSAIQGSTTALTQTVTFSAPVSPTEVSFTPSASGGSWLSVSPVTATNTTQSITITANPTGLTANTYSGTVTLSYGNSGAPATTIPVTFTIGSLPTLTPTPSTTTGFTFNYQIGTTAPTSQPLSVAISSGSGTVNAAVTPANSWLIVSPSSSPASTTTPASFTVSVSTSGLTTAQTLQGNIQLTASGVSNSPINIPVTFNVGSSTLSITPAPNTTLTFNYQIGGTVPTAQNLNLGNSTAGISFSAGGTVTSPSGGTWLTVSPTNGTISSGSAVSVGINQAGLSNLTPNTYTGTVTVTSTGAAGSPATYPINLVVTGPTLTTNPAPTTGLSFTYQIGSAAPSKQPISITSSPSGITFNAASSVSTGPAGWLQIDTSTGTTPGTVNASLNTSVFTAAGTFQGSVTISASGATSQVVPVTVTVTQPTITANPAGPLAFAYQIGTTAPAAQQVTIGGTQGLQYTATPAGGSWLLVNGSNSAASGTISNSSAISVSIATSSLTTAGTLNGTITLTAPGATQVVINVTLTVSSQPTISASPSTLTFNYQIGATAPPAQTVNIGGTSGLSFTVTSSTATGGPWLNVTPTSGTTGSSSVPLSVSLNTSALTTVGTFTGTISVTASGASNSPLSITVNLTVSNLPSITATPSSLTFSYAIGGTAPTAQSLQITGGSGLSFTAAPGTNSSWLSISPGSGATPGSISVSLNTTGLTSAETLNGTITVTASGASNSPLSVPVTLTVTNPAPKITLSATSLNFTATGGTSAPPAQTVNVTSSSSANPVTVAVVGGNWLSAFTSSGTTPSTITVSANQSNLAPGTYQGAVIVNTPGASNPQQVIDVMFVVSAPTTITSTPSDLSFAYSLGGSNPPSQSVKITSSQPAAITTSVEGASWLTVTGSGSTPATLTVTVDPSSLPEGTYQATVNISGGASSTAQVVPVKLIISSEPMLAPSPSILTFLGQVGGSNPPSQSINLSANATLPYTVTTSPSWLSVATPSGTTPASLVTSVNTAGLSPGSYQGEITITSSTAANDPLIIPVTVNIDVPLVETSGPTVSSIVNSASYDMTGFAPGAIVSIFGSLLGPTTGASFALNPKGSLNSSLAGVTVSVDGVPAIPLFVQDGQVNVILPFNIGTSGEANVEVTYNSLTSAQFNIPLTPADVQIFTVNAKGTGPGSILNQDFSVNSASNPAAPGSVVSVYGTGGGIVNPPVTAGDVAGDTLSVVALPFSATVNGEAAVVLYAGTAPGLVYGVYQFNVQLPTDLPSGELTIQLQVGGSTSQSNVTLFVK